MGLYIWAQYTPTVFHQFVNLMIMYMDHLVLRFARLQVKNIDNFVHIYMKVITFT